SHSGSACTGSRAVARAAAGDALALVPQPAPRPGPPARPAMSEKAALLRVLARDDASGDGFVPVGAVRGLLLHVLQDQPSAADTAESLTDTVVREFSTPRGQRVRYLELADWLFSGAEDAGGPPGLADVLERARRLHSERQRGAPPASPAGGSAHRERWCMLEWLSQKACAPLVEALVAPLPSGSQDMEFAFAQALGQLERERAGAGKEVIMGLLRDSNVLEKLSNVIVGMATELTQQEAATGGEMNSKFASDPHSYSMSYGTQCDFFAGLEDLIGSPDPRVERAMMREHCNADDSRIEWTTENYGITTTPEIEWHFVCGKNEEPKTARRVSRSGTRDLGSGRDAPPSLGPAQGDAPSSWKWPRETVTQHRREWKDIGDFKDVFDGINAKLKEKGEQPLELVEWIGGRLYTGPMFEKYNAVNRGGAVKTGRQSEHMVKKFNSLCRGNRYCTTIHAINSALIKLSKLEKADKLYRGTQRGVLPECFWNEDESGVRGGIEYGFLSCSRDLEVAKQYVQDGRAHAATIFEIQTGMIDRGADLSLLSQYPHEREICFPPLTGMEVLGSRIEGSILYIQMRLNVNFSALTIDQVINKRKRLVTDMCKNLRSEVSTAVERYQWATAGQYSKSEASVTSEAVRELAHRKLTSLAEDEAAEHFNNDETLLFSIRMALEITDSVKWLKSSVLREAADHLRKAEFESAAACAERHAKASSSIECKLLDPITIKREDTRRLQLTQGSNRLHILDKLQLCEAAGAIQVQDPHPLFKLGNVHAGYTLYMVNGQTDVAKLPHELISERGAEITFQRPLSSEELKDSLLGILRQAKTDAASVDRQVLEVARALALNPLKYNLFLKGAKLDADSGKVVARALGRNSTIKDAVLSKNVIGVEGSKAMKEMLLQNRTLRSLLIDSNNLGPAGGKHMAEALEGNDTLHNLRIGWNGIGEESGSAVAEALSKNTCLRALNTECNELGRMGGEAFGSALRHNACLLALHIDGNKLGPEGGASIATALETNSTLTSLWIPQNELGERGGKAFAKALRSNTSLSSLGIANNGIGSEAGAEIAEAVKGNTCLKTLRIGRNELGAQGGKAFAEALSANSCLSSLELSDNDLQAEATVAIAKSLQEANTTLTRFDTVNNSIGVEGLRSLAAMLHGNTTLKVLKLHGNGIGPGDGEFLGPALGKNGSVTTLWLDGAELSGEAMGEMLRSNATLEVLALAGGVSSAVVGSMERALAENADSQLQTINLASDDGVEQDIANLERTLKERGKNITIKIGLD
ncbi:unnamed protein product, partial [Prorocentrum cordatum]